MNPKIHYPVGRRIRDLRKRHRITQEELATWLQNLHAPITRSIIANWETGRGDVPAYCIQLIALLLGAKVADILPDLTFKARTFVSTTHPAGRLVHPQQPAGTPNHR